VKAGSLLDLWVLGAHFLIPPVDIKLFKEDLKIWTSFIVFDSEWILTEVNKAIGPTISGVQGLFTDPKNPVRSFFDGLLLTLKGAVDAVAPKITGSVENWLKDPAGPLKWMVDATAKTTWDMAQTMLDEMAADYYKRHSEEKK